MSFADGLYVVMDLGNGVKADLHRGGSAVRFIWRERAEDVSPHYETIYLNSIVRIRPQEDGTSDENTYIDVDPNLLEFCPKKVFIDFGPKHNHQYLKDNGEIYVSDEKNLRTIVIPSKRRQVYDLLTGATILNASAERRKRNSRSHEVRHNIHGQERHRRSFSIYRSVSPLSDLSPL